MKRYAREEQGAGAVLGYRDVAISALSRVEVCSALWRKVRTGQATSEQAAGLATAFEHDLAAPVYVAVLLTPTLLDRTASLVAADGLRAGDAVQLACALAGRELVPRQGTFALLRRAQTTPGCVLGRPRATPARGLPAALPDRRLDHGSRRATFPNGTPEPGLDTFLCFDHGLAEAAQHRGFTVVPG